MTSHRAHDAVNRDIQTLTTTNYTQLATRIHNYLNLDNTHNSTPDGMPTQTIGASPSTGHGPTLDADVALTSVEAAVEARRHHKDEIRTAIRLTTTHLNEAARHLQQATNTLDNLDQYRKHTGDPITTEPGCDAMKRVGAWEHIAHKVTIDNHVWQLGEWSYRFLARNERLPTIAECQARAAGRRVMVAAK